MSSFLHAPGLCALFLSGCIAACNSPVGIAGSSLPATPEGALDRPTVAANGALWYWRAFHLIDHERLEGDYDQIRQVLDDPESASEEDRALLLKKSREILEPYLTAAKKPMCAFGIDRERHFSALLPHLAMMREATRLARAQARHDLAAGEIDSAVELTVAIILSSRQQSQDQLTISSLVGWSLLQMGDQLVEPLLQSEGLQPTHRTALRGAFEAIGVDDPLGFRSLFSFERKILQELVADYQTNDDISGIDALGSGALDLEYMYGPIESPEAFLKDAAQAIGFLNQIIIAAERGDDAEVNRLLSDETLGSQSFAVRRMTGGITLRKHREYLTEIRTLVRTRLQDLAVE